MIPILGRAEYLVILKRFSPNPSGVLVWICLSFHTNTHKSHESTKGYEPSSQSKHVLKKRQTYAFSVAT